MVVTVLPETVASMSARWVITSIVPTPIPWHPVESVVGPQTSCGHRRSLSLAAPKLVPGGASMIYVRSRRSIVTLGLSGLAFALLFALLAAGATRLPGGLVAAVALAAGAIGATLVAAS